MKIKKKNTLAKTPEKIIKRAAASDKERRTDYVFEEYCTLLTKKMKIKM